MAYSIQQNVDLTIMQLDDAISELPKNQIITAETLLKKIKPIFKQSLARSAKKDKKKLLKKLDLRIHEDKVHEELTFKYKTKTYKATHLKKALEDATLKNVPNEALNKAIFHDKIFGQAFTKTVDTLEKIVKMYFNNNTKKDIDDAMSETIFYDYERYPNPIRGIIYIINFLTNAAVILTGLCLTVVTDIYTTYHRLLLSIEPMLLNLISNGQYEKIILSQNFSHQMMKRELDINNIDFDPKTIEDNYRTYQTEAVLEYLRTRLLQENFDVSLIKDTDLARYYNHASRDFFGNIRINTTVQCRFPRIEDPYTSVPRQMELMKKWTAPLQYNRYWIHLALVSKLFWSMISAQMPKTSGQKALAVFIRALLVPTFFIFFSLATALEILRLPRDIAMSVGIRALVAAKAAVTITLNLPLYIMDGFNYLTRPSIKRTRELAAPTSQKKSTYSKAGEKLGAGSKEKSEPSKFITPQGKSLKWVPVPGSFGWIDEEPAPKSTSPGMR